MGNLIIHGNPYTIDKIVVNDVEYPRRKPVFHIFFDNIECHTGDTVKIYHDPERQWVLHSDDEKNDLVHIWKNTRITGTILEPAEYISFVVPEGDSGAVLEIISNQGNNDNPEQHGTALPFSGCDRMFHVVNSLRGPGFVSALTAERMFVPALRRGRDRVRPYPPDVSHHQV